MCVHKYHISMQDYESSVWCACAFSRRRKRPFAYWTERIRHQYSRSIQIYTFAKHPQTSYWSSPTGFSITQHVERINNRWATMNETSINRIRMCVWLDLRKAEICIAQNGLSEHNSPKTLTGHSDRCSPSKLIPFGFHYPIGFSRNRQ